ncbi:MAG TPA: 16S rRNA (guanine(527)-N(7))-methyltransferase RsmG, partial [Spirochaetota bacterium]|nr:16S rRNA (guanine(527)-N(7))-methyltransferase RsmG [Spirochaetota bacterium]
MYQKLIKEYFDKASLYYTEEIISRFNQFLHLLLQYNKSHDLTRITNIDEIIIKHFVDSLIITKFITIPSPLLDIGTGAGFPGIPLAIVYPDKRFILAESRHKRTQFLSIVNESLQLKNIEIYPHLVTEKSFFEVGGVITRAVESINETLQRCNHFLKEDNSVLLMKGPSVDEENITMSDSYSKIMDKPYTLPATSYKRRLIVYKKTNVIIKKTYFINKEGTSGDGLAITSGDNKHYKELKKIIADPRKCSMSTVVGKKIIKELVSSHPQLCRYIVLHDGYGETDTELIQIITDFGQQRMILLKKALFNEIDVLGNNQPILVIDVPPIAPWDMNTQGLSLMIPFQD